MSAADRLVEAVCAAPGHSLAAPLRGWCASSRPFLAFAQANTTKLRRKVREAAGLEAQADVWAELAVAAWLLRSGSGTLTYEPLKAGGGRGPDFALSLPNGGVVYVEVARLRSGGSQHLTSKLARVLADKIGQLPPGAGGVLAAALPTGAPAGPLAPDALRLLARAAQGEVLPGVPPEKARAFERLRVRLSGVLLLRTGEVPAESPAVTFWGHGGAAHPLSPAALRCLQE